MHFFNICHQPGDTAKTKQIIKMENLKKLSRAEMKNVLGGNPPSCTYKASDGTTFTEGCIMDLDTCRDLCEADPDFTCLGCS